MMPSCDHTGVPGFAGLIHFHSSTTSGSAAWISWRTVLRASPRRSAILAIRFEISFDADWPGLAPDCFMFASWKVQTTFIGNPAARPAPDSRRPAEGNKFADPTVPQVQAAPGENSYDQRNRRARRVCDPQMGGQRPAELAPPPGCGEDRRLRDKVEHHQGAFRNEHGADGRL